MRPLRDSEPSETRSVNHLLHTLRGEQFRHSQNVQRSRSHVSSALLHNSPTICVDLSTPEYHVQDTGSVKLEVDIYTTSTWRAQALDLILGRRGPEWPAVPPLSQLCFQMLATFSSSEFAEDVVPFLPSHLCRDLIRYTAIHSPLPPSRLYAMYAREGHAHGELLIVGPQATLPDDFFIHDGSHPSTSQDLSDWDSEKPMPLSLCTFIMMSTPMTISIALSLPPTIKHMALLNLPTPIALHRLPGACPLLELLDLSYNTWLSSTSKDASKILERVQWSRWSSLRVLGLRDCLVSDEMLQKLNKGRWEDVRVVGG